MVERLQRLSEARGVPGHEGAVRAILQSWIESEGPAVDRVFTDPLGNLYVGIGVEEASPALLLAAHMDEVGFLVSGYTEEGLLRIRPSGGIDPEVAFGKPVQVGDPAIPGVIGVPPPHLAKDRTARPRIEDCLVDIGAEDRDTAMTMAPLGAMVTFDTRFVATESCWLGKALDDRLGCLLLWELLATRPQGPLWCVFTVQEEVGLRGAVIAARRLRPALALIVEATPATDVGEEGELSLTRWGGGAALTLVDRRTLPSWDITEHLVEIAESEGIPWQWRRGVGGTTDGAAFFAEGIPTATISVPCRYIHGPAALAATADVLAAGALLRQFVHRWRKT